MQILSVGKRERKLKEIPQSIRWMKPGEKGVRYTKGSRKKGTGTKGGIWLEVNLLIPEIKSEIGGRRGGWQQKNLSWFPEWRTSWVAQTGSYQAVAGPRRISPLGHPGQPGSISIRSTSVCVGFFFCYDFFPAFNPVKIEQFY